MTPAARLHGLLADRFSANDLQQLVALDDTLTASKLAVAVNFDQATGAVALALVEETEKRGLLSALAAAALRARPLVPEVREVAALFGAAADVAAVADPAPVRFAAGQFNMAFVDRRRLLGRLETYKGLHDILHQLQASHGELVRLVKAAREPGYDPLDAGNMPDTLTAWLDTAGRSDRPLRWVPAFVRATRLIARCVNGAAVPAADADPELDRLGKFPADEQGDLNERLVELARDLDVDGLDAPLRALRTALGPAYGTEFQQRYDQFRLTCATLRQLIDDHDECQAVEAAIAEAGLLVRQPAGLPPRWADMRARLDRLAATRPGNTTVDRLIRMVTRLADAGAAARPDWLPNLQAGFGQFFFDLDAELLDATDRVLQTADVLDFRLRGYSQ